MQASSSVIFGCMSLGGSWDQSALTSADKKQAFTALDACLDTGITQFDHADIYKFGKAEKVFGEYLGQTGVARESLFIQSKCGIQLPEENLGTRYNLSSSWIIESCERSLKRLNIDYLDSFLLHRPDPLMQPEEIASAFQQLFNSGKVKRFGVSNMSAQQLSFINSALDSDISICINQLALNLLNTQWLDACVDFNCNTNASLHSDVYNTLLFSQAAGISTQAWGSLAQGRFSKSDLPASQAECQALLHSLAQHYQCDINAIQLAWLMQLPFNISPVIGTANPERIKACKQAEHLSLSREHWYALYAASRERPLP